MDRTYKIPPHILDDLCSRFILNLPDEERKDMIRAFFHIEFAHWFYIDFFVSENPELKIMGIKEFAYQVFGHCPFLLPEGVKDVAALHEHWKAYKLSVPTYGCILLDPLAEYVLLVQGYSKSWGFPKGKVNEGEEPDKCAVREVMEETGFDATGLLDKENYVEHMVGDMKSRLYIIPDVSLETNFLPQTRNEIRKLQWFPIELLPTHKRDTSHSKDLGCGPNSFFMAIPFVRQLKQWLSTRQSGYKPSTPKASHREKKMSEAQRAFAQRNIEEYEAILSDDPGVSPTTKHRGRKTGSPKLGRTRSPQYTILEKDNRKKLSEIRRNLDLQQGELVQKFLVVTGAFRMDVKFTDHNHTLVTEGARLVDDRRINIVWPTLCVILLLAVVSALNFIYARYQRAYDRRRASSVLRNVSFRSISSFGHSIHRLESNSSIILRNLAHVDIRHSSQSLKNSQLYTHASRSRTGCSHSDGLLANKTPSLCLCNKKVYKPIGQSRVPQNFHSILEERDSELDCEDSGKLKKLHSTSSMPSCLDLTPELGAVRSKHSHNKDRHRLHSV